MKHINALVFIELNLNFISTLTQPNQESKILHQEKVFHHNQESPYEYILYGVPIKKLIIYTL